MRNEMQDGMAEATRLTREGRLAEATALIQRTLGARSVPAAHDAPNADEPVETTSRVVKEAATPSHSLRRPPRPARGYRSGRRPSGTTENIPAPAAAPAGGSFVERSYTNRAGARAYKLYVPGGYVGQAVSLIVMLHGCTQGPEDLAAGTRMNDLAEEHTFLVAYPAQSAAANRSKCWNWFKAADQRRGQGEPSIIAGITREISGEYNVAGGQIYVAGMSAGGAMATIMGTTYPDLYAAIGVHSGLAPGAAHDLPSAFAAMRNGGPATAQRDASTGKPGRTVPIIVFHGDRDTTVHPRNADHLLAHYCTEINRNSGDGSAPRTTARRGQVPGGHAYTHAVHHDAGGRVIIERWTVHGLGHAWSGGSPRGSYTDPKGPDASAEMVRFFQQHRQ